MGGDERPGSDAQRQGQQVINKAAPERLRALVEAVDHQDDGLPRDRCGAQQLLATADDETRDAAVDQRAELPLVHAALDQDRKQAVIQAQERVPDQVRLAAPGRPGQLDVPGLAKSISQLVRGHRRAVPDQGKRDKLVQAMPVELVKPPPVPGRKLPGRRLPSSLGARVAGASHTVQGSGARLR